jgi:hypothetical protein
MTNPWVQEPAGTATAFHHGTMSNFYFLQVTPTSLSSLLIVIIHVFA